MKSKKSLIIAPALAALFVAAAGSVSGTVAWFSSVRVFNTEIAEFSVVETDGSLECVMAASQGTEKVGDNIQVKKQQGEDASPTQNAVVLTHGSVNVTNGHAYVVNEEDPDVFNDKGENATSPSDVWKHQTVTINETKSPNAAKTVDVYYAVSWTMTFTYTFAADSRDVAIYLDLGKSVFGELNNTTDVVPSPYFVDDAVAPRTEDTAKGFRIGFYGTAANVHDVVWGYNDEVAPTYSPSKTYKVDDVVTYNEAIYKCSTEINTAEAWNSEHWTADTTANNLTYVSAGDNSSAVAHYTNLNYVTSKGAYERLDNGAEANKGTVSKAERIAYIEKGKTDGVANVGENADKYGKVTVNCAAWFEGTDPNVITGAAMKCMKASMSFYARALAA